MFITTVGLVAAVDTVIDTVTDLSTTEAETARGAQRYATAYHGTQDNS